MTRYQSDAEPDSKNVVDQLTMELAEFFDLRCTPLYMAGGICLHVAANAIGAQSLDLQHLEEGIAMGNRLLADQARAEFHKRQKEKQ